MEQILIGLAGVAVGAGVALALLRRRQERPIATPQHDGTQTVAEPPADRDFLDALSEGVILLNDVLLPVLANSAARSLLKLDEKGPLPSDQIMSIARRALTSHRAVEDVVDLWGSDRVSVLVSATPLDSDAGVVVALKDVSAEQRALRLRRQFVSHASHELKSPVASIQALGEAIARASTDDPVATREFAGKLLHETARVGKLVRDLLDLSRIEDPGSFRQDPVEVSEVVRLETDEARSSAEDKGVRLIVRSDSDVWTRGDVAQLRLLVRNLLDNAIRYTPEGGRVVVETEASDSDAIVRVADDGIGIPLKAQARVFERFYRVDEARSRDQGGTGLGLAIVKHVADLYGGRVELRSQFGEGSVFTTYLPLARRPARSESA